MSNCQPQEVRLQAEYDKYEADAKHAMREIDRRCVTAEVRHSYNCSLHDGQWTCTIKLGEVRSFHSDWN